MPLDFSDEPDSSPNFSVVMISYNTRDMTLACLASIYEETSRDFEVIMVDNASTDGSAEAIAREFPRVKLVRLLRAKVELIKRHFSPGTRSLGLFLLQLWPLSRHLGLSLLMRTPNCHRFQDKASAWRNVWQRRAEWRNGF